MFLEAVVQFFNRFVWMLSYATFSWKIVVASSNRFIDYTKGQLDYAKCIVGRSVQHLRATPLVFFLVAAAKMEEARFSGKSIVNDIPVFVCCQGVSGGVSARNVVLAQGMLPDVKNLRSKCGRKVIVLKNVLLPSHCQTLLALRECFKNSHYCNCIL